MISHKINQKTILLLIILIGIKINIYAEPQFRGSDEVYNYWAKRSIIEMVYVYMEDQESKPKLSEGEKMGKKKYSELISNSLFSVDSVNSAFKKIPELLKTNNWESTYNQVFKPLQNNIENRNGIDNDFFNIKAKDGGFYTSKRWEYKKDQLISEYNKAIKVFTKEQEPQNNRQERSWSNINQIKENNNKTDSVPWVSFMVLFLVGFLCGAITIFFISKQKIYSIIKNEKDKYLHELKVSNKKFLFNYIGLFFILKNRKDNYKNQNQNNEIKNIKEDEIKSLQNHTEGLKQENKELQQQKEGKNHVNDDNSGNTYNQEPGNTPEIKPSSQNKTKYLYFIMPEIDGTFVVDNGDISNDGKKYFKIEYSEDSTDGKLFFISSARDPRAINRLESHLIPVCEIENIANAENASRIEFISPGEVILRNDKWVIKPDNKMKIKLI